MFLAASLFLVLVIFILLLARLKSQMAALVAWIVGTIAGSNKGENKDTAAESEDTTDPNKAKSKKGRQKSKKSPPKEPTFSTSLTKPIEEVIEETLIEENLDSKPPVKSRRRNKNKPKNFPAEDVGFSFFRTKSLDDNREKLPNKKAATKASLEKTPPLEEDSLGFSFLPVKKTPRRNQKVKIDDLPKSSLIEHFKTKKANKTEPVAAEKIEETKPQRKPQSNLIEIVNKGTGKVVYLENKESKKVHSKISYASVTTKSFEESLAQLKQTEQENNPHIKPEVIEEQQQPILNSEDQSEDLVFEIESEERRLVHLIEASQEVDDFEDIAINDLGESSFSNFEEIEVEPFPEEATSFVDVNNFVAPSEERGGTGFSHTTESSRVEESLEDQDTVAAKEENEPNQFTNLEEASFVDEESRSSTVGHIPKPASVLEVESSLVDRPTSEEESEKIISSYSTEDIDSTVEETTSFVDVKKFEVQDIHAPSEEREETRFSHTTESSLIEESVEDQDTAAAKEENEPTVEDIPNQFTNLEEGSFVCEESRSSTVEDIPKQASVLEEGFHTTESSFVERPTPEEESEKIISYLTEDIDATVEDILKKITVPEEATSFVGVKNFEVPSEEREETRFSSYTTESSLIEESGEDQDTAAAKEENEPTVEDIPNQFTNLEETRSSSAESTVEDIPKQASILEEASPTLEEPKPFKMSSGTQIRVLTLNEDEHQASTLYRIEKNWIIQFRLGPSLLGRKVSFFCNYPKEGDFDRSTYNPFEWSHEEGCAYADDTALLIEIKPKISGSFHYYFTYSDKDERKGSGFFLVDPVLRFGNNEELPLDCIQCQTVLTKHLGTFDTWENKLRVAKESGYNMVHFTPIQQLGVSNSSYSLSEQLKVNPLFETTFEDIGKLTEKMRNEWKMLSICDIVLNHTANESDWLEQHPEVTYNCQNCAYLRPAYLLDAALHQFSVKIAEGFYEDKGAPPQISTEEHLASIRYYLHADVTSKINLHEMWACDVNKYVAEFLSLTRRVAPTQQSLNANEELELIQDPQFRRFASTIDMKLALKLYNVYRHDCFDEETRIKRCAEDFKSKLDSLNRQVAEQLTEDLKSAVENIVAAIRYFRVQLDGPRIARVSAEDPLVARYFTDFGAPKSVEEYESVMYGENGKFLMAHNGWVMNSDPLRNFAAPGSRVYLRRELIAWGDSVKLRFGDKPEDCPFLWNYMKEYVELTARVFDGVRLDNCHSTPIPVAEYLLDCARKVKPDLYVVAELFTNSDSTDNIFVNRLGITSLIREAMSAWDSHEQGRLVYRYGGSPVGSFYQPRIRPLVPSIAHALFLDLTHDNPSPVEKRSVFDLLPSTALVNMACCASGSNRGYDELVPHHIHVVDETREYTEWASDDGLMDDSRYVGKNSGIVAAKKALNDLHFRLGAEGFNQVYVDQMDSDIVAVTRHCPETHQSYVLVAFTAFTCPSTNQQRAIKPLRVEGVLDEIVLEATLTKQKAENEDFQKDTKFINGLSEYQTNLKQHVQPCDSDIFENIVDSSAPNVVQLNFKNFKPGSVAVIKVSLPEDMKNAINAIRKVISQFSLHKETELGKIISEMTLPDLNRALYRCDQEERDEGYGFDTYNIPNFGRLVYAGFQGFMSLLSNIRPSNDLGHPMCANLRDGNWMIDYIWQRLKLDEGTKGLGQWFEENMKSFKLIPRYLVPCYFDAVITGIYVMLIDHGHNLMSDFVKNGSAFVKALAMGSLQLSARIKSADLPTLSPHLSPPKPPQITLNSGEKAQACVTLSAGLPHFAVGYMRNWGRDTFIALRGLFLLTGRFQDARYHLLAYGACLRHGLIPNLLDGGRNPRFNCRDAVWWWLYCIKCYAEEAPDGVAILEDKVSRVFPKDDSQAQPAGAVDQALHQVMQEALNTHFQGLVFRERNAGKGIDEHMSDQGFDNQIGIHPETGFVFGGNSRNAGTWMDKMGSSDKAGNRGIPATPRDGSAIELIGLAKAVVSWLHELSESAIYPYKGVERTHKNGSITKWSFGEWAEKIQENFEKYFWVGDETDSPLINKRGIYKDCHGSSQGFTDFQLRCNFPVAMVVAPELFNPRHAWRALEQAEKYLLGPLGMRTLDPEDWAYNGNYDNSNDSDNRNVAHGFNYHQGPEWVWPIGFYLRAKLQFAAANGELEKTVASTKNVLAKHFVELQTSTWRGLPELTNENGAYCNDSCRTQAWSMSSILEVLNDLQKLEKDLPLIN